MEVFKKKGVLRKILGISFIFVLLVMHGQTAIVLGTANTKTTGSFTKEATQASPEAKSEESTKESESEENVKETVTSPDTDKKTSERYEDMGEDVLSEIDDEYLNKIANEPISESTIEGLNVSSVAAVLMEGSTGKIIYEKNSTQELRPASITKIMTLLLIFEALESGQIKITDMVPVSEHAASMGGSQVYLEPNETQDVDTMIKCISIASANDASVAMGEFIAGSEESFVARMNEKAKQLGMNHTNFVNCYGLDEDNHYSCAMDVAIMSRELITRFPQISNYATVWMDTFVHTTRKGQTEFGLTNTNKLIKSYNGITGLKTGSTGLAKYCLSATARRNNMDLIAVIMAAPDTKTRFAEASKLLNYGFANCSIYMDSGENLEIPNITVKMGVEESVKGKMSNPFSYLCMGDIKPADITKEVKIYDSIKAPLTITDSIGEIVYYCNGTELGKVNIVPACEVKKAGYGDYFSLLIHKYF